MQTVIAPSLLSANFAQLGHEVQTLQNAGADWIHLDIMDGHFVPNLTIGPVVIQALRPYTTLPFDCHLMIEQPERYVEAFAQAGADILTVHVEACRHLHRNLQQIRSLPHHANQRMLAGVSLNPHTPISSIVHVLELCDLVLLMTVNPGFAGQSLIEQVRPKIRELRAFLDAHHLSTRIEVDGGINAETIADLARDGADTFVSGSGVFSHQDYQQAIAELRSRATQSSFPT